MYRYITAMLSTASKTANALLLGVVQGELGVTRAQVLDYSAATEALQKAIDLLVCPPATRHETTVHLSSGRNVQEELKQDREYAEQAYRAALTAREVARDDATRQSRYLATYIKPTRAQGSEYPKRYVLVPLAALFLVLIWSIVALIYYSIRDRS